MAEGFVSSGPLPLQLAVPPAAGAVGFFSMLAFWMGGASTGMGGVGMGQHLMWRASYGIFHHWSSGD